MKAVEEAIYCQTCVPRLLWGASMGHALQYPAYYKGNGTCRGCDKTVKLQFASKVVKKEKKV